MNMLLCVPHWLAPYHWLGGHCLRALSEILCAACARVKSIERVPSGDFLFHVPYQLRRNVNLYANFFKLKPDLLNLGIL